MKHERIVAPRVHPLDCRCANCSPRLQPADRLPAWALATALMIAFAVLIHT